MRGFSTCLRRRSSWRPLWRDGVSLGGAVVFYNIFSFSRLYLLVDCSFPAEACVFREPRADSIGGLSEILSYDHHFYDPPRTDSSGDPVGRGTPSSLLSDSAPRPSRRRPIGKAQDPGGHGKASPVASLTTVPGTVRARPRHCLGEDPPGRGTPSSLLFIIL